MKKIILKTVLISVFITLCSFVTVSASTSDVFDDTYFNTYGKAYGSSLTAPSVSSSDDLVDVSRGEVSVNETDYVIPTSKGFDIPVNRTYNLAITTGIIDYKDYSTKYIIVTRIGYYYTNQTTNEQIVVAFSNEKEAMQYQNFMSADVSLLPKTTDDNGLEYILIANCIGTNKEKNCLYVLDKSKPREYITKYSYSIERELPVGNIEHHLELGGGWIILKPGISREDINTYSDTIYYDFTFMDIYGNAFNAEIVCKKTGDGITKYRYINFHDPYTSYKVNFVNNDNILQKSTHPMGFDYTVIFESDEGMKYYFETPDYYNYKIRAVSDKYDNTVLIDSQLSGNLTYTTDDGTIYEISETGITKNDGQTITQLVSYNFEYVNSPEDETDYFELDDFADFTVYKRESETEDILQSKNKMQYRARQILVYPSVLCTINTTGSADFLIGEHISKITYLTGLNKNYEYTDVSQYVYKAYPIKYYESYEGVEFNRKNIDVGEAYTTGGGYVLSTTVSHYKNSTSTSGYTENYTTDDLGRIKNKVSSGAHTETVSNAWSGTLYKAPLGRVTKDYLETSYSYTSNKLPAKVYYANTLYEQYTYGEYNIPTEIKKFKNNTDYIKTVNTVTSDGKSIAQTTVYDGGTLKESTSFTYDSFGNITSQNTAISENESVNVSYQHLYDANGGKTLITTASGIKNADGEVLSDAVTSVTTDIHGNVLCETDANGNVTSYEYDLQHRLKKITFPDSTYKTYSYDIENNVIVETDARGNKMKYTYNPWGQLTKVEYYEDNVYKILEERIYDYKHNLSEYRRYIDDTSYSKAVYTYDKSYRLLTEMVYDVSGTNLKTTTYTYSRNSTKINGRTWNGYTTTATVSGGGKTFVKNEVKVDDLGRKIYQKQTPSSGDARTLTYTTDFLGNELSVKYTNGSVENYSYNHDGSVNSFTNSLGDTMYYSYDMAGNNTAVTDFNGNTTNYIYDVLGRQIKTVMPFSDTATSTTKTYYDLNGNVTRKSVQNNAEGEAESYRSVDYVYDNMNRLSYTVEHPTVITNEYTQYFYDANGNVQNIVKGLTAPISSFSQRPSSSKYLTYSYDALNRNTGITGSLCACNKLYAYDRCGNVIVSINGNNIVDYTYDPFGNVLTVQGGDDESKYISYSYNALGLRSQMTDETGTTNYAYNDFGELISETKGGIVKTSGYNNMGMRTSFSVKNNGSTMLSNTYTYDTLGRMTSVTQGLDVVSYAYDNNGNLTQRNTDGHITTYTYNKANLRIGESADIYAGNFQYIYYLDGNLKGRYGSNIQNEYVYDSKNRLINSTFEYNNEEITYESYEYDKFDNRTKYTKRLVDTAFETDETFVTDYDYYSGHDMLTLFEYKMINNVKTLQSYTDYYYDTNGNLEIVDYYSPVSGESKQTDYEFDYLGRLTNVYDGNSAPYSYTYDGDNLRQTKTVNGETTSFILDGMDVAIESGSQNTITYLRGMGLEGYLKNGTSRKYYYNEPNGSTYIIYGDENNNYEPVGEYAYGGFGNLIWDNWQETSFAYAGEYHDDETGFIYLRNRYYDPSIGRFISEDPIRSGTNWYVYANNNPVKFTDSMGLDAELDEYVKNNYSGKVTVTIAAQRPVENSRIAVNLDEGDVGHTFVRIDYGDGRVIYRGFYPSRGLTTEEILTKADVTGSIVDDSEHDWNAAVTYEITAKQADKMVQFIEDYDKKYNMVTNNCTTFGVQVLKVGGLTAPTSKHKWTLPDNARQMVIDNLPTDKWFKGATADYLFGGLKGYSPADAVQDFKNVPKYVLKYGGTTHICTNTGKSR